MKNKRFLFTKLKILFVSLLLLSSCKNGKLPGADARKVPYDPRERVAKNIEEGRGFRLSNFGRSNSGTFDFASSNELWRASLDTLEFMPLALANYSGGIIVTDWYAAEQSLSGESVKISIRFLTNEVRSDAIEIKVFNRKCINVSNCIINELNDELGPELKKQILKRATLYKKQSKENKKN